MIKKFVLASIIITLVGGMPLASAQAKTINVDSNSLTVLIDKSHPLEPRNYIPPVLVVPPVLLGHQPSDPEMQVALPDLMALTNLFKAAGSDGINLALSSGYRSYEDQARLYADRLSSDGVMADEAVALPGYSEHQSGLAADVILTNYFCAAQGCFALSRAAAWLSQNSYRYGWVIRYPLYKEASTGYEYEPWHLRYLGVPLAERLHSSGQTLEEFYGLP